MLGSPINNASFGLYFCRTCLRLVFLDCREVGPVRRGISRARIWGTSFALLVPTYNNSDQFAHMALISDSMDIDPPDLSALSIQEGDDSNEDDGSS